MSNHFVARRLCQRSQTADGRRRMAVGGWPRAEAGQGRLRDALIGDCLGRAGRSERSGPGARLGGFAEIRCNSPRFAEIHGGGGDGALSLHALGHVLEASYARVTGTFTACFRSCRRPQAGRLAVWAQEQRGSLDFRSPRLRSAVVATCPFGQVLSAPHIRSKMPAAPMPPPMHMLTMP